MENEEFNKRFYKFRVPQLDTDMIPVLVADEGVFSPCLPIRQAGRDEKCLKFKTKDEAIAYWVDKGYKVFVMFETRIQ